jgi:hypothetical protein
VVGFAQAGVPEPEEPGYESELWKLYISPNAQRQGVGRALMRAMAEHLLRDGVSTMCLRAFVGNRAADFYTRIGGQEPREEPYEILGSVAPTILYGWPDLTFFSWTRRPPRQCKRRWRQDLASSRRPRLHSRSQLLSSVRLGWISIPAKGLHLARRG